GRRDGRRLPAAAGSLGLLVAAGAGTMAGSGTRLFAEPVLPPEPEPDPKPEPDPATPHSANPPSTAAATIQARTGCLIHASRCRQPRGCRQSARSGKAIGTAMWIVSSGPSVMTARVYARA